MKPPIRMVLDTNVVLDCFVFRDAAMHGLIAAIGAGHVQPLVHPCTLDELGRVLVYPQCRLDANAQREVLDRYLASAIPASMPQGFGREELLLPADFPRCRDRDDQVFLALAYHARADALVTKDRVVLRLRRRVRRFGLAIRSPAELVFADLESLQRY